MMNDISLIPLPDAWSDWKLLSMIGKGAYASVYKAQNAVGEIAAIKIMEGRDQEELAAEAEILMKLSQAPGIVRIFDYAVESRPEDPLIPVERYKDAAHPEEWMGKSRIGTGTCRLFIRMEYLTDLKTWSGTHPIREPDALRMMADLCTGLESCEKAGVLHRDIKPENILVTEDGHARLCDFGVSRMLSKTDSSMTVQGTFAYMAPEVYHGRPYDQRADLYSLALVFYQLMNQRRLPFLEPDVRAPFEPGGDSFSHPDAEAGAHAADGSDPDRKMEEAMLRRMKERRLPPPSEASADFARILLKACAFHPYNRYTSAAGLRRALTNCQDQKNRSGLSGAETDGFLSKVSRFFAITWFQSGWISRIAFFILFLLLLSGGGYFAWSRTPVIDHEVCGDGVVWTLYHNGTLVVSGKGIMLNTNDEEDHAELTNSQGTFDIHLLDYQDKIKKIIVEKGVLYAVFKFQLPNLREITFSETLEGLGNNSLSECPKLTKVYFCGEDARLGDATFSGCDSLQEVVLPTHLTEIPDLFLCGCKRLEELNIPKTVRKIGGEALVETPWDRQMRSGSGDSVMVNDILYAWKGEEENPVISRDQGIRSINMRAFEGSDIQSIVIGEGVEDIGKHAFSDCRKLEKVVLPEGLKELSDDTFNNCSQLREVLLPESLETIGNKVFYGCKSLKTLHIPESVTKVGWQAFDRSGIADRQSNDDFKVVDGILFAYSGEDKDLVIPKDLGIRGIAADTFTRQMHIESAALPDGLEWVGEKAFFMCYNLREITWPESLTYIGPGAFEETAWMEDQMKKSAFVVVNDILIHYGGTESVLHFPEDLSVSRIAGYSFSSDELKEVFIPGRIKKIDENAFTFCFLLNKVHFAGDDLEGDVDKAFEETPWIKLKDHGKE